MTKSASSSNRSDVGESVEHYETIRQRKDGSQKLAPMAELT
jgi:hypothetical protein